MGLKSYGKIGNNFCRWNYFGVYYQLVWLAFSLLYMGIDLRKNVLRDGNYLKSTYLHVIMHSFLLQLLI